MTDYFDGLVNYETWVVALWTLREGETLVTCPREFTKGLAKVAKKAEGRHAFDTPAERLAVSLQHHWSRYIPKGLAPMWEGLLQGALMNVDWYALAVHVYKELEPKRSKNG